eukprot:SAG11_NODE_686_length_7720_cov_1.748327_7_plen_69_part_00
MTPEPSSERTDAIITELKRTATEQIITELSGKVVGPANSCREDYDKEQKPIASRDSLQKTVQVLAVNK